MLRDRTRKPIEVRSRGRWKVALITIFRLRWQAEDMSVADFVREVFGCVGAVLRWCSSRAI